MTTLVNFAVDRNVGRNPVARSIERARLRKWLTAMTTELYLMAEGEPCGPFLKSSAEAIGSAIKAIEGFDDPADVGGLMVDAMGDLARMANAGRAWQTSAAERVAEALDCAVQILCEVDARTKLLAWQWARQFTDAVGVAA